MRPKNKTFFHMPLWQGIPAVDFHMHTNWTDGQDSVECMYQAACANGLETILFTEHARAASCDWFGDFTKEVRVLPNSPCRALVGVEVKIVSMDGRLDSSPEILSQCDLVVASVHRFPGESSVSGRGDYSPQEGLALEYRLLCAAVDNPEVDILGHPFGMSIRRFGVEPPEDLLWDVAVRAARRGVAFEINTKYHHRPESLLALCMKSGGLISLGSDAHCAAEVGLARRILKGRTS